MCTILSINFLSQNNSKQRQNSEKSTDSNFCELKRQTKFFGARNNFKQMYSEKSTDSNFRELKRQTKIFWRKK